MTPTTPEVTITFERIGDVSYDSAVSMSDVWIMSLAGRIRHIRADVVVKKNDAPVDVGAQVQPGDVLVIACQRATP